MKQRSFSTKAFWGLVLLVTVMLLARSASAQCRFPACNRDGERFISATGDCEHRAGFPTFAISHRAASCPSGERFDRATGECVIPDCDERCEVRRLCRRNERYSRSDRDREGVYGVCDHTGFLGAKSHRVVRCPFGSILNERRGVCVRCPTEVPVTPLRADLVFTRSFLRVASSPTAVTRLTAGTPYLACFEVANRGTRESGTFRVGGGGLGVRTPPNQAHASLLPGATREGCLSYATTPPPGSYRLVLTVDSFGTVRELREDNNTATLTLTVVR